MDSRGDRSLTVFLMADLQDRDTFSNQLGFESLASDDELIVGNVVHDGTLADTGVSDHNDGLF